MRNKIKQLMNKEEGFTLVELLAVIVILGIIVAIAVPSIGNVIERAQEGANTAQTQLVEDAARLYFVEYPDEDSVEVSLLISEGYLDERANSELLEDVDSSDTITRDELFNTGETGDDG